MRCDGYVHVMKIKPTTYRSHRYEGDYIGGLMDGDWLFYNSGLCIILMDGDWSLFYNSVYVLYWRIDGW